MMFITIIYGTICKKYQSTFTKQLLGCGLKILTVSSLEIDTIYVHVKFQARSSKFLGEEINFKIANKSENHFGKVAHCTLQKD